MAGESHKYGRTCLRLVRIASLLPSATEIVYALGLGEALVGRSPECDYPHEVAAKPVVSTSVFDGRAMVSPEIDATVRRHVGGGEGSSSLYHIDVDALRAARVDLLLTQALCDVCAASVDEVRTAANELDPAPEILTLSPTSLDDVLEDIVILGGKTDRLLAARELVHSLRQRLERVQGATRNAAKPRVACIEWFDPIFTAGHWVPEQVAYAGGREMLGTPGRPSRTIPWEQVCAADPEVLVLMACGFDVPRGVSEAHRVTERDGFAELAATREGRVFVVDGSSYFNRPGPRVVEGVELLAHVIHPELFTAGWPDTAVRRLS